MYRSIWNRDRFILVMFPSSSNLSLPWIQYSSVCKTQKSWTWKKNQQPQFRTPNESKAKSPLRINSPCGCEYLWLNCVWSALRVLRAFPSPANVTMVDAGGCDCVKEHLKNILGRISAPLPCLPTPPLLQTPHVPRRRREKRRKKKKVTGQHLAEFMRGRELVDHEKWGEFFLGQCKRLL